MAEIDNQKAVIDEQAKTINDMKEQLDKNKDNDAGIKFKSYVVVAGDNLSKICENNNINYDSNKRIILSVNGIENANQIYIGQTILLPIEE